MDHLHHQQQQQRSNSGNGGEENIGIPDDLRCKRSDGKQWRCTAMSMPDKTVCEKHYVQAKKRAASSALRASLKKVKQPNSFGEEDDDGVPKDDEFCYSLETPQMRGGGLSILSPSVEANHDDTRRSYKMLPASTMDMSMHHESEKTLEDVELEEDFSDGSTDYSDDTGGPTCHQCHRNDRDRVIWCKKCDRRGYCSICISTWYSDISLEEITRICPACRGTCKCKPCLRGDSLIKVRIREIPILDKLQYHHRVLSSVLPAIKQIHHDQCREVEWEKRLRGREVDLARMKLNADEQMCCNFCRLPIIDYHRHCANCSYDLCIRCCKDLREASEGRVSVAEQSNVRKSQEKETMSEEVKLSRPIPNLSHKFIDWHASSDGNISCPPKVYGGCGLSSLTLSRIFKMNWVAKLVKNAEEMVRGCKVVDDGSSQNDGSRDARLYQAAQREDSDDNFLFYPFSEDVKLEGVGKFTKLWLRGEPVVVKQVCDSSLCVSWDPMLIRRGIQGTTDEKTQDENKVVKAIDCLDWSEIEIELGQFIKGYSEGRIHEYGWPQMLKLKDWPSSSASEEFLVYQKPEFVSKLPLLEYIHFKWGLLNIAAKMPHCSLHNDVGPKIFISYGKYEELGRGDSVTNLHFNMSDMVFVLVHTSEIKLRDLQDTKSAKSPNDFNKSQANKLLNHPMTNLGEECLPEILHGVGGKDTQNEDETMANANKNGNMEGQGITNNFIADEKIASGALSDEDCGGVSEKTHAGALWDVFRRCDVPKLINYMRIHRKEFGKADTALTHPLFDEVVFLNRHHKRKLKEEFGVEPWSFEQHLGEAVFIPAGCPFQARNLQSTVQLGLDFLSPESLGEAIKLNEEIRCLPNDHEAKTRVLEVGKMSLYAASAAIKEVNKLVLDPMNSSEIGVGDLNLTSMVSENLEKMVKRMPIGCA